MGTHELMTERVTAQLQSSADWYCGQFVPNFLTSFIIRLYLVSTASREGWELDKCIIYNARVHQVRNVAYLLRGSIRKRGGACCWFTCIFYVIIAVCTNEILLIISVQLLKLQCCLTAGRKVTLMCPSTGSQHLLQPVLHRVQRPHAAAQTVHPGHGSHALLRVGLSTATATSPDSHSSTTEPTSCIMKTTVCLLLCTCFF